VYLEALSELQDRLPSFPNEIAWAVMEEELGRPVAEVYDQLSEQPVAAASLGQVYKGILRETGDVVAVKVQRPAIGESIAVDMLLLRRLMAAVDNNLPQVSQPLVPLVDEFAARLFAELDYVAEGHNAERFQVGSLTAAIRVSLVLRHSDGPGLCQSAHWPGRPVH
jgi:predicted unusual protein kinase regulating ubiquinone biosynthesis (AarF/ABC1/UbiB family)